MNRSQLDNVYLFKSMNPDEMYGVREIAQTQNFAQGESIFMKGDAAKAMYLIQYGSVKIQQTTKSGDNIDVAILGTGSHFGDMPFVDGEVRSATAVAVEKCELVVIPYDKLNDLLSKNVAMAAKFYRDLARFMCGRLRATTSDLNFAREKYLSHF